MADIFIENKDVGEMTALQLLSVGKSFYIEKLSKATHIQSALAKVNVNRAKKGKPFIRITQKIFFKIDPKTGNLETIYKVTRVK